MPRRVVILGAGLAGLSAALRLQDDCEAEVHERDAEPGGVARTRRSDGFTFDYTGHLLHLRDPRVKATVEGLLPGAFRTCERKAAVFTHGRYLPYPFQANLAGLPREVAAECLVGFVEALVAGEDPAAAADFGEWTRRCFGAGISRHFMVPYNRKLFRRDLSRLTAEWVSWSVPRPSLTQVVHGALGVRIEGLGYNPTYLYPAAGGIDCIARALAQGVRGLRLSSEGRAVDLARRVVTLASGEARPYDHLVSTLPLPDLLRRTSPLPAWAHDAARGLAAVGVAGFNFGIAREELSPHDWVYVPEPDYPFYRVGFPSTFSPESCPPGHSSACAEVSFDGGAPPDLAALERQVQAGLVRMGVLREDDRIVARGTVVVDPAYVLFDAHRAAVRDRLLDFLLDHGVQSVGRYGAWTYSSMEDAILAGWQAADVIAGRATGREHRAGDR